MNTIKYFFQFLVIIFLFFIFKILGLRISSSIGGAIFQTIGPFFRSKKIITENIKKALPNITQNKIKKISRGMWNNYGRIFAEYMFIKKFRMEKKDRYIIVEGQEILNKIKYKRFI